ncbi:MAG: formate dehydrogenase accessory sulfurtransferase FdhD [Terracidiphilus sp.]
MDETTNRGDISGHEASMSGTRRPVTEASVVKIDGLMARQVQDNLATEEPLEIQLGFGPFSSRQRKSISITMRTPGNDFELAAGFLMTEGVVHDANDIEEIAYALPDYPGTEKNTKDATPHPVIFTENAVRVELAPDVPVSLANLERNFYTTSSCGICGKASLLALRTVCPPRIYSTFALDAEVLYRLPGRLLDAQSVFGQTGGLHGAGLFDANGELLAAREDVGRHNAVDKLIGSEFLADRTPLRNSLLLLSGRASFELLQKALMGGVPMVASVGAPSSLAVKVAKEFDITLIGFLRENQFNIYHGEERIRGCISPTNGANQ